MQISRAAFAEEYLVDSDAKSRPTLPARRIPLLHFFLKIKFTVNEHGAHANMELPQLRQFSCFSTIYSSSRLARARTFAAHRKLADIIRIVG